MNCNIPNINYPSWITDKTKKFIETEFSSILERKIVVDDLANGELQKWAESRNEIEEGEDLNKINGNTFKKIIRRYIAYKSRRISKTAIGKQGIQLRNWTDARARKDALKYTAYEIAKEYFNALNNQTEFAKGDILGITRSRIQTYFIDNIIEPYVKINRAELKDDFIRYRVAKAEYNLQQTAKTFGSDKLKNEKDKENKLNDLFKKVDSLYNNPNYNEKFANKTIKDLVTELHKVDRNDYNELAKLITRLKHQELESNISTKEKLFNIAYNIGSEASNVKVRNWAELAFWTHGFNMCNDWMDEAISTSGIQELAKVFRGVKLEKNDLYDLNLQDEIDTEFDENENETEDDENRDMMASAWEDTIPKDFSKQHDGKIKLYLETIPQVTSPIVDKDSAIPYKETDTLGTIEYMDGKYLETAITSFGPYYSVEHMIEVLTRKANTIPSLYGLGKVVNDMKEDVVFANFMWKNFAKPVIDKIQIYINEESKAKLSNEDARLLKKIYYNLLADGNIVCMEMYKEDDYETLTTIESDLMKLSKSSILDKHNETRNKILQTLSDYIHKNFPSVNIESFKTIFFDNSNSVSKDNLIKLIDALKQYTNGVNKYINSYNKMNSDYLSEYTKYRKISKKEGSVIDAPMRDYSSLNATDRNNAVLKLAKLLVDVVEVGLRYNSINAEGKMASDINKSSYITNFVKLLKLQVEEGKDGREIIKDFFTQKKYDITDNETNILLFGLKDRNGVTIRQGIITKDIVGNYIVNKDSNVWKTFNIALFDGAKDENSNKGNVYANMSREDYLLSSLLMYGTSLQFEGMNYKEDEGMAQILMRIPSDASNTYSVQMQKFDINDLFDTQNNPIINNFITTFGANLDKYSGKFNEIPNNIAKKYKEKLNKIIKNNYSILRNNVLPGQKLITMLTDQENIEPISLRDLFYIKDKKSSDVYIPFVYRTEDSALSFFYKGNISENGGYVENLELISIDSATKDENQILSDDELEVLNNTFANEEEELRPTISTTTIIRKFVNENRTNIINALIESGEIKREINKNSHLFLAIRSQLWGELQQFVTNLNNILENGITKKSTDGLIDILHHNKKGIVDNGKLTGRVFHFDKLFDIPGSNLNINNELFEILAIYEVTDKSLFKEPLLIQTKDGRLKLNENRTKGLIRRTSKKFLTIGDDFQNTNEIKRQFSDKLDELISDWLNNYITYIDNESKQFEEILIQNNISNIREWALNTTIAYMTFDGIFEGSSKYYRDAQTFLKRAKEVQMGGTPYASSFDNMTSDNITPILDLKNQEQVIYKKDKITPLISNVPTYINGGIQNRTLVARNGFRAITIKNSETKYTQATQIYETLKDTTGEEVAKNIALEFGDVKIGDVTYKGKTTKTNDAQSYITIEEFIRRRQLDGTLNEYLPLIEQLLDDNVEVKDINAEGIAKIQAQKNVYYDLKYDVETGLHRPRQIKNAEFVLIPKLLPKDSQLMTLYELMRKHDIGQVNTIETSKASNKNVITFWDNDLNVDKIAFESSLTGLDPEALDSGTPTYPVVEDYYYRNLYKQLDVVDHIEDKENKAGIQLFKKIIDNTRDTEVKKNADNIQEAMAENIKQSYLELIKNLGWKIKNGELVNQSKKKEDAPLIFNEFYYKCLEEFKRTGLDGNIVDYLTPGENGYPIMPEWMSIVSTKLENIAQSVFNNNITRQTLPGYHAVQVSNFGYANDLKYYPVKEGSEQLPIVEIRIPAYSKAIKQLIKDYGEEEALNKLKEAGLDEHVGYCIPTEGKQSMAVFKIVGFLPESYGSTMMLAKEWITQTGKDFDIDSIYALVHELTYDEKTKQIKKIDYNNKSISEMTREERNNFITDNVIAILKNKASREEIFGRSNFDDIGKGKEVLEGIAPWLALGNASVYNPFDQLRFMQNAIDGRKLKAFSVNRDTFCSICNKVKPVLNRPIRVIYGENSVSNVEDEFLSKINYIPYKRVGEIIDSINKGKNICNATQMICIEMIGDAFNNGDIAHNVKAWPLGIWAKSPLSNDIIGHEVTLVKVNGQFYIFDMPQSEFIIKTGNTFIERGEIFNEGKIEEFKPYLIPISKEIISEKYDVKGEKLDDTMKNIESLISYLNNKNNFEIKLNNINKNSNSVTIHNKFGWSENENRNIVNRLITSYSSQTTAHILDAIKMGSLYNETDYTFKAFKTLVDVGVDYTTAVVWLAQPAITRLNQINNTSKSIYTNKKQNPIETALKDIAIELGIINNYYTDLESIKIEMMKQYKDVLDKFAPEKFNRFGMPENLVINYDEIVERIKHRQPSNEDLAFDFFAIMQFEELFSLSSSIEDIAKVLRPDSFGAKQTIYDTRKIIENVEIYRQPKGLANIMMCEDSEGNKVNIIDAIYGEHSGYPYLKAFYEYATLASFKINSRLFKTEQKHFQQLIKNIEHKIGKTLTKEEYIKAKKYIIKSVYDSLPILNSPINVTDRGFIEIDKEAIEQQTTSDDAESIPYWEQEVGRIYGFREYKENIPYIENIQRPTKKEIDIFKKLTPAQKILFVKSNFAEGSVFDYITVKKELRNEITKKNYSYNRLYLHDLNNNIDRLRLLFADAYFNSNPLLKLTAIDVIKYAFIVEGYDFRKQFVGKLIPNNVLYTGLENMGMGIVTEAEKEFNALELPTYYGNGTIDNFIRANSNIVDTKRLIDARNKERNTVKQFKELRKNGPNGLIIIPKTKDYGKLYEELGLQDRDGNYINVVTRENGGNQITLYRILSSIYLDNVYLVPINPLEEFENREYSVNNQYHKYSTYNWYINYIRETHDLTEQDLDEFFNEAFDEEQKSGKKIIEKLSSYERNNSEDENKLINFQKEGSEAQVQLIQKFFNDINDVLLSDKTDMPVGASLLVKNASVEIAQILNLDKNEIKIFNIPGINNYEISIKIKKFNPYYLNKYKKQIEEGKRYSKKPVFDYYIQQLGDLKSFDNLYEIELIPDDDIAAGLYDDDVRDSRYDDLNEVFAENTLTSRDTQSQSIAKLIVDDIRFFARKGNEQAEEAIARMKYNGLNLDNENFLNQRSATVLTIAGNYYQKVFDLINGQLGAFILSNGEQYAIDDQKLYQNASPKDIQRIIDLVLKTMHLGESFRDVIDLDLESDDKGTNKSLNKIKEIVDKLNNDKRLKKAINILFNKYFVQEYSTNPNLRIALKDEQGNTQYMIEATDVFGDTKRLMAAISDVGNLPHKQIQMVVKAINSHIYSALYTGREKVEEYEKWIKDNIKGDINEVYNKIIDENGTLILPYNESFIKDKYQLIDELNLLRQTKGVDSEEYRRKEIEFKKWKVRNLEQQFVVDYYKEDVELEEWALNNAKDVFLKYMSYRRQLYNELRDSYDLTDEEKQRRADILSAMRELRNQYDENGNFKPVEELQKIQALQTYINDKEELEGRYFEKEETEIFRENLKYNLAIVKQYDEQHKSETLQQKLNDLEYRTSYTWLQANTRYILNKEASKALSDAHKALGISNSASRFSNQEVRNILEKYINNGTLYDVNGVRIGTNISDEDINYLWQIERKRYSDPGKIGVYSDAALIKMIPETEQLSDDFWINYYVSPDEKTQAVRERKQVIYKKINDIISKGINKDTGELEPRRLFDNCTQDELDELKLLYRELKITIRNKRTLKKNKKGNKLFEFKTNEVAFARALAQYYTLNAKEKNEFEEIFCEQDDNGFVRRDKHNRLVANGYLYGYVELTEETKKLHPEFIDKKKTDAIKLIQDNEVIIPTQYYYDKINQIEKEAQQIYENAITNGKSEKEATELKEKHIQDWYEKNHVYNKYTHKMQPLSIWTKREISPNGTLSGEYSYEPVGDNFVKVPKDEFIYNKNYSKFGANYKEGDDKYKNRKYNSLPKDSDEYKLFKYTESIMLQSATNNTNKNFIHRGWMPRQVKPVEDRSYYVKQGIGALGLSFNSYDNRTWHEDIDYYHDFDISNPMLQLIKTKGYQKPKEIPQQLPEQSNEDYQKLVDSIRQENRKIEEENRELEKKYIDRDWFNVFRNFIYKREQYEAREDVKNIAYLMIDDLKTRKAYKVNGFGNVSRKRGGIDESPSYNMTSQQNTVDVFSNWIRRIIFGEYKELNKLAKYADSLQNMSSAKYMMFNLYAGINNVSVGLVNIFGEAFAKDHFGQKEFREGLLEYGSAIFSMLKDTFSEKSNNRTVAILKLFDIVEIDRMMEFTGSDFSAAKIGKYFNTIAYSLQSGGEHFMQNSALIAMMKANKVWTNPETNKKEIVNFGEYTTNLELAALNRVISGNPEMVVLLNSMKKAVKKDKDLEYKYDKLKRNIIKDFFDTIVDKNERNKLIKEYISLKKEMLKNDREEFEKLPDVWSQFELVNGIAKFKKESGLTENDFGALKNRAQYVNKFIHGVYDKSGAAQIEKYWWGSLLMQFKKHIYPGVIKRWGTKGYWNESRGSFEKGSYLTTLDFLALEFKDFKNKATDEASKKITALKAIQTVFQCTLDTIHNFKYNYELLPVWEQNNIRRTLADLCGIFAALLTIFAIYALTDDDDLENNTFLNSTLYLADRLYGESRMYMPQGIIPEVKTQWSQPVAGKGVIEDLADAMSFTAQWLWDPNYEPIYKQGPYKGQNKVKVKVLKNIPAVRTVQRIKTINKNNKYYRIGDNATTQKIIKSLAFEISGKEE